MREEDIIRKKEEVGFFFLKHTTIFLCGDEISNAEWFDVDIVDKSEDHAGMKRQKVDKNGDCSYSSLPEQNVETCCRCNVVLYTTGQKDPRIFLKNSEKISFNGCIDDIKCCTNHLHNPGSQVVRSDGALLLGTIMQCRNAGYVRVESFKVKLSRVTETDEKRTTENEEKGCQKSPIKDCDVKRKLNDNGEQISHRKVSASIAITVSLPHLETVSKAKLTNEEEVGCAIEHYDDYISLSKGGFPAYGRLLFSLMRSDWEWLEKMMEQHIDTCKKPGSNERAIFPSRISLEELYVRIRGTSTHGVTNIQEYADGDSGSIAGYLSLPEEVLESNLAPYLRAKSLHSLRSTCKYLNHILRSVAPGMKLRLFPHQVRSLSWMRQREEGTHKTEEDAMLCGPSHNYIDGAISGDLYRCVTSGCISSVAPRYTNGSCRTYWHINTSDGSCSIDYRNERVRTVAKCRNIARGGLLCDDPGLGKTITILSLILQTFGQSTLGIVDKAKKSSAINDDLIIDSYWREILVSHTRKDELLGLVLKLRKCDQEQFFQYPVEDVMTDEEFVAYRKLVDDPLCMEDIIGKIRDDVYDNGLDNFVKDVKKIYENAKLYNKPDTLIYKTAGSILRKFEDYFEDFRGRQLQSAINASKRSKRSLGTLISQKKRKDLLHTLLPSKGTLLVVPSTLLQHWEEQIKMHIDFSACSKKQPVIYRHRVGNKFKREYPCKEVSDYRSMIYLCEDKCSHFPFLFIDECNEKLPSEDFLARFSIVLTTTKRLTAEWKNGSFEEELRKGVTYRGFNYDMFNEHGPLSPCSLLKIYWLRLVVDEGHSMGKANTTNAIDFASWISAERRWAMTGTPTPQSVANNGTGNLFGLLKFLKHDYFCTAHWGEERCKVLSRGIKDGHLAAFFNLRHLLNLFMVRHTKNDIKQLHKPIFTITRTEMSAPEKMTYNTLVTAVQINLITTSMEGKTSGMQDSLLNARHGKHAKEALGNIRLACCGGTSVVPTLTEQNWDETIKLMRKVHNASDIKITLVRNFLSRMTTEQLSSCMSCGIQLQTLFLLPCGCQICTECINPKTVDCPAPFCNSKFDVDDFQKLQPGLDYTWKWNIVEAMKKREQDRAMEEPLESVRRREGDDNMHQDRQNNGNGPPINNHPPRANNRRLRRNEAHVCQYPTRYRDGKCLLCGEIHNCSFVESAECEICNNKAEDCPREESKAHYITNKLINLLVQYKNRGVHEITMKQKRPLKCIIFTQFQKVSNVVGDRLIRRFGTGCIAEYWGKTRHQELMRFTKSKDCFCLLLNKDGSHGLNLSFVTHIFFLDEIFDKSLESQVIARAYRMGATENVFVEQLVARQSIEELMVKMNKHEDSSQSTMEISHDRQRAHTPTSSKSISEGKKTNFIARKVGYLLSNVKLIRPPTANMLTKRKRESQATGGRQRSVKFQIS